MMPFEERWWDVALKLCHSALSTNTWEGLHYTQIEKREDTLAWRIACELQAAYDAGVQHVVLGTK